MSYSLFLISYSNEEYVDVSREMRLELCKGAQSFGPLCYSKKHNTQYCDVPWHFNICTYVRTILAVYVAATIKVITQEVLELTMTTSKCSEKWWPAGAYSDDKFSKTCHQRRGRHPLLSAATHWGPLNSSRVVTQLSAVYHFENDYLHLIKC